LNVFSFVFKKATAFVKTHMRTQDKDYYPYGSRVVAAALATSPPPPPAAVSLPPSPPCNTPDMHNKAIG
jgi:hypothetical protein